MHNWTLNCRNEEQVNLWHKEIQRLMDIWKGEEKDMRRNAKVTLQAMKDQATMQNSSFESLDSLRSARRPVHPLFEAQNRTRARNGSLDLGVGRPDLSNGGRNRSCSVTSSASDMYDPRDSSRDEVVFNIAPGASRSAVDLSLSPGTADSTGNRSATSSQNSPVTFPSPIRENRRNAISHTRSASQASEMSIGYSTAVTEPIHPPPPKDTRLSARLRSSPLPPQLPAPLGPQPPLPTEMSFSYSPALHSSPFIGHVKPLPTPPTSNLRQRVGDRIPAPLVPATSSSVVPSSGNTPQSTLPELPSREIRRPLSNRKSNTPLRGPRERGSGARTPVSAHAHELAFDTNGRTRSRSRSHSNPLIDGADPRRPQPPNMLLLNNNTRARHRRQGSESSSYTVDSVSILTASEDQSADISPVTPPPHVNESRPSPVRNAFSTNDNNRSRTPHLVSSGGAMVVRRAVSGSKLDLLESPPAYYAGPTPKTAQYSANDVKHQLMSGSGYSEQTTPVHQSSQRQGHSHKRSTSATGLGRTGGDTSMMVVRLHYDNTRLMLRMSHATSRSEFIDKVRQKIRLCGATPLHSIPPDQLDRSQFASEEMVSYLNEANQFVRLDKDADFAAAWKSVRCRRRDPADSDVLILAVGPTDHLGYAA